MSMIFFSVLECNGVNGIKLVFFINVVLKCLLNKGRSIFFILFLFVLLLFYMFVIFLLVKFDVIIMR